MEKLNTELNVWVNENFFNKVVLVLFNELACRTITRWQRNTNFESSLISLLIRATEENNKLKTRYEQAKEESENLVSTT